MSTNVEQAEVEAILEAEAEVLTGETVGELDFRRPRRLSVEQTGSFRLRLERGVTAFTSFLDESFAETPMVEIREVYEAVADDLENTLPDDFVAIEFLADSQVAWVVTESILTTRIVDVLLGGDGASSEANAPSPTENRIVAKYLEDALGKLLGALGGEAPKVACKSDARSLASWRDAGPASDPYRVVTELVLTHLERSIQFSLWLPGGLAGQGASASAGGPSLAVPRHLAPVDLSISVELDGCEVTLDELLSLEVGDVIPVDARVGDPVRVTLDGKTIALGIMGQREGQMATRLIGPPTPPLEADPPQDQN